MKPGPANDFDASPAMQRVAFDMARRQHADRKRVDAEAIAENLRQSGYRTTRWTVDRWLRRQHPELFNIGPRETR